eukprot:5940144-Karenia_brevis.AAC.1
MIRMMLGAKRRVLDASSSSSEQLSTSSLEDDEFPLETWQDFMKRTAKTVDSQLRGANLQDWVTTSCTRQWRCAGRLAQQCQHKWSYK